MSFPPNTFLIGAQKAGTTYLANLLDQIPEIGLAVPKEPHFFTQHWERGLPWYHKCFPDPDGRTLLDASTSYSAAPVHLGLDAANDHSKSRFASVPRRIREISPDARFIYLLRHPVERTWSSYWHDVRNGEQPRPFSEAIQDSPHYTNMSDYLLQIRLYLRTFPIKRFLFLRFEDLRNEPEAVVQRCLQFMDVSETRPVQPRQAHTHASYIPGPLAGKLIRSARELPYLRSVQKHIWQLLPETLQSRIRTRLTSPIPDMDPSNRRKLEKRFRSMVQPLEEITSLDLSAWRWVLE